MKLRKKDIGDFFLSYGYAVIIFAVLNYVAFFWVISKIDAVKSNERINFFFEAYSLKENTLSDDIKNLLKDDGVVESNVYCYSPNDSSKGSYYDRYGTESDFIVLTENDLKDMFSDTSVKEIYSSFVPFDSSVLEAASIDGSYEYYVANEKNYALKIFSYEDASYNEGMSFDSLMSFNETDKNPEMSFYLLINAKTPNFAPFSSSSYTTNGVKALEYVFDTYGKESK